MTINANSNVGGAAAALATLQALQLSTSPSGQSSSAQISGAQIASSSGLTSTTSGSPAALSQSPLFIFNATGQTAPSQSTADDLAQGASLTDSAGAVAQSLSALLGQIQQTATTAADPSLPSASRQDLSSQFAAQISGFSALLASAQINGQNLLNGSLTANPTFAIPGGGSVSVQAQDLTLGGPLVSLSSSASVSTASAAASTASLAGLSITSVDAAIGQIYDQGDQINSLSPQLGAGQLGAAQLGAAQLGAAQLGDGATVDASSDSSGDSARLLALQLQQTLSAQPSTSLSNPSSQAILSLFRG
jgi:flagellin